MKKVILIAGKKGVGKDYVASCINHIIEGSRVDYFAKPLKDIVQQMTGFTYQQIEQLKNEDTFLFWVGTKRYTMRTLLQQMGTEILRGNLGDQIWGESLYGRLLDDTVTIIPDYRFGVEYHLLNSKQDVAIITVLVKGRTNLEKDYHISENDEEINQIGFNFIFNNNRDSKTSDEMVELAKQIQNRLEHAKPNDKFIRPVI